MQVLSSSEFNYDARRQRHGTRVAQVEDSVFAGDWT